MSTSIVPIPLVPIATRVATMADLPFIDALQKLHSKALGYFPTKQFEDYIGGGHVLIAQDSPAGEGGVARDERDLQSASNPTLPGGAIGYVIAKDRYLKRDELGVIYQLCVAPGRQRGLIGAALVKAAFDRAAYGCRLFCCWCAQDLEANHFWESLGFVPLAFRTGSARKTKGGRVHIFWQRRIDAESITTHQSPYWYPFQTNSGAIREDRIVFPIPPGVHWSEVKAVQLPVDSCQLPVEEKRAKRSLLATGNSQLATSGKVGIIVGGRIKYVDRPGAVGAKPAEAAKPARKKAQKAPKAKACPERSRRIDPKYLSAARELRDRYLERVNGQPVLPHAVGKYDVRRTIDAGPLPLLGAA